MTNSIKAYKDTFCEYKKVEVYVARPDSFRDFALSVKANFDVDENIKVVAYKTKGNTLYLLIEENNLPDIKHYKYISAPKNAVFFKGK